MGEHKGIHEHEKQTYAIKCNISLSHVFHSFFSILYFFTYAISFSHVWTDVMLWRMQILITQHTMGVYWIG